PVCPQRHGQSSYRRPGLDVDGAGHRARRRSRRARAYQHVDGRRFGPAKPVGDGPRPGRLIETRTGTLTGTRTGTRTGTLTGTRTGLSTAAVGELPARIGGNLTCGHRI